MRIAHTADWHLGQTLHGASRDFEHDRFLTWLLDLLAQESIDALIVAGDIFDVASPGAAAQERYYRFLGECRRRLPELELVIVGGNHDSPGRLDAPKGVLEALGITVIGGLPLDPDGEPDLERLVVPLAGRGGSALVLAVPFLRPRDLATPDDGDPESEDRQHSRLVRGHRALYRTLTDRALARRAQDQAILATGHAYLAGGVVSALSERKIQMGNQHALPADIFPPELAYVALGHLHRAQTVGGHEHIRYSGSPIPLSMTERLYEHQVVVVELDGPRFVRALPFYVPRAVPLICVPERHAPFEDVLRLLAGLPRHAPEGASPEERPFLEVRVKLEAARPHLRREIEEALGGAWARLLRIDVERPGRHADPIYAPARAAEVQPVEIFSACYERERGRPPPADLLALFAELLERVQRGEGA